MSQNMELDAGDLVSRLVEWLRKRGEPDSGIRYEAGGHSNTRGVRHRLSSVELHGSDADFIAKHFHGQGARDLADAISRLSTAPAGDVVAWPKRRVNVPYIDHGDSRVVGFVIEPGDEAYGDYGLSEPLAWLDRMCAAPTPSPQTSPATEGEVVAWRVRAKLAGQPWRVIDDLRMIEQNRDLYETVPLYAVPPPAKAGEGEWRDQKKAAAVIQRLREIVQGGMDKAPGYQTDKEIYGQMHMQVLQLLGCDPEPPRTP